MKRTLRWVSNNRATRLQTTLRCTLDTVVIIWALCSWSNCTLGEDFPCACVSCCYSYFTWFSMSKLEVLCVEEVTGFSVSSKYTWLSARRAFCTLVLSLVYSKGVLSSISLYIFVYKMERSNIFSFSWVQRIRQKISSARNMHAVMWARCVVCVFL